MLEALVSVAIAGIAGGAALNNRLHQRVNNVHDRISGLDRRIDAIELGVAQDYVSKADLSVMTKRCLLYTSPSPRDTERSRMPSSA